MTSYPSGKASWLRVLASAATETLNLLVGGVGLIASTQGWPFLACGGVTYAFFIAYDVASPSYRNKVNTRQQRMLPDPSTFQDLISRSAAQSLLQTRAEFIQALRGTPQSIRQQLGSCIASFESLEERAVSLIKRIEALSEYLRMANPELLRMEIQRLTMCARETEDVGTQTEYECARTSRREQLETLLDIALAKDRTVAQLIRLQAILEGLPPKIVRIGTMEMQSNESGEGEAFRQMEHLTTELACIEEGILGKKNEAR